MIYRAPELEKTRAWYVQVLGKEPYFSEPFYVGFNVGGYELGLDPNASSEAGAAGPLAYWGVASVDAALTRLVALGARLRGEVQDVGDGIRLASVDDPFGNVLGIIENPHFKLEA